MAINVTSQILHEGPRNLIMQWTGISDGSGSEDGVVKVDVSSLTPACDAVKIMRISGSVEFGVVELYWDALTPEKFAVLSGSIDLDYCKAGGLVNSMEGGANGDLLLSTVGFELNSSYILHVEMVKK
jgi:hypothetical protein